MIRYEDVLPLVVQACPSFEPEWAIHKQEEAEGEEILSYMVGGDVARHLARLYASGDRSEFAGVFGVIERVLIEGEEEAKNFAAIGLLEYLQNEGLTNLPKTVFEPWLGPESAWWWRQLNRLWAGEISPIGWSHRTSIADVEQAPRAQGHALAPTLLATLFFVAGILGTATLFCVLISL